MATVMETFVGNYLLNKLEALTEDKAVMTHGRKDDLNKLVKRMRSIAVYLRDAERRRITDSAVNNWLNELKDVVYDADDMTDLWRYNNKSLPFDKPLSSSKTPIGCNIPLFTRSRSTSSRHSEVAQQLLKALNVRLEEIYKRMARLNLQKNQPEVQAVGTVDSQPSSAIEPDVVGNEIEEGVNKLVKLAAINNKKKFSLVAITGMGGIGKTTLAQKVYNNTTIQNRYAEKLWLSVSQKSTASQLIKAVIRGLGGNPGNAEKKPELLSILANAISGRSFFLVLDGVWNPYQSFNLLQNALKSSATYGFILITTRDQRIAMRMGANYIHQVKILSPKSGLELLCKRAYLIETDDIKSFEDIGAKIVDHCGGLPLAIKAIAGMLATKNKSKKEWENVMENRAWSIGGFPEELDRVLYLCYEDLSPQLKQCFLHCSLFAPNIPMSCYELVRFWIAEGLIEERSGQVMENVAKDYYHELIRRHLLEPNYLSVDQTECQMHSLLRSLARYMSKEESFTAYQVLTNPNDISRLRRLSLLETDERTSILGATTATLRLRTLIIFKCLSEFEKHSFVRLKHLRVLHINEKGLNFIPESIGDLIHLRMLDLKNTSISTLPESIGFLTNLLFLNLNNCKLLHILPRSITRLCNLSHLNITGTPITSVPKGLGGLQKLNEIFGFQVGDSGSHEEQNGWDLKELEGLSQLRRISITKLERARNVSTVLANKTHLKHLFLIFSMMVRSGDHMEQVEDENSREILEKLYPSPCIEKLRIMNYRSKALPKWMSSSTLGDLLPNVQYCELIGWSCCTVLPPLGSLPNLKYLKVQGASGIVRISSEFLGIVGRKGPNLPIAFPKLEYLTFENMPNWEEWVLSGFEEGNSPSFWQLMPQIKVISIEKCPKLRALPEGLKQITAVQKILIRETYNIKSIKAYPFECEFLLIENNQCLEIISDLPRVKQLMVGYSHKLRRVSKLDSLEYIELVDYSSIEGLPKWLITLMEERKDRPKDKLHLVLFCTTALLKRCLKNGPDWPIIKCFSAVTAYNRDKTACLEYTREPESYITNLRE